MRIIPLELPTSYPVGPVNAYLFPGPPVTLVDCGPKTDAAQTALEAGLARAGTRLADIERLVITHAHIDHFGLAGTIAATSGATVYAHRTELPKLTADTAFIEPLRIMIGEAGFPPGLTDTLVNVLRSFREQFDKITPGQFLGDGDRLPLSGGDLTVLHTPGHAQGHICLWDGESLIAGDLLLEEISPNPIAEFDAEGRRLRMLPLYVRSLRRVGALAPAVAYPGHGDPIAAPGVRITEILTHHEERKERLAQMLAGRSWTLRDLAAAWYSDLDLFNLFLALSEVIGHLDLLEDEGRVTVEQRAGVLHYTVTVPHAGPPRQG